MDVTFYHQVRADGGRRTGLEVDGEQGLESFVPDGGNHDPALRWYVDVTWRLDHAPATREEATEWYAAHLGDVGAALEATAERLSGGLDAAGMSPARFEVPTPLGTARVAVGARRRLDGVAVAEGIRAALAADVPALTVEAACAGE